MNEQFIKKNKVYTSPYDEIVVAKKNASTVERSLNHFNDGLVVAEPLFGSPCSFRLKLQDGFSCEAELIQPQVVLQPGHAGAFQRCFRCFAVCDRSLQGGVDSVPGQQDLKQR